MTRRAAQRNAQPFYHYARRRAMSRMRATTLQMDDFVSPLPCPACANYVSDQTPQQHIRHIYNKPPHPLQIRYQKRAVCKFPSPEDLRFPSLPLLSVQVCITGSPPAPPPPPVQVSITGISNLCKSPSPRALELQCVQASITGACPFGGWASARNGSRSAQPAVRGLCVPASGAGSPEAAIFGAGSALGPWGYHPTRPK